MLVSETVMFLVATRCQANMAVGGRFGKVPRPENAIDEFISPVKPFQRACERAAGGGCERCHVVALLTEVPETRGWKSD